MLVQIEYWNRLNRDKLESIKCLRKVLRTSLKVAKDMIEGKVLSGTLELTKEEVSELVNAGFYLTEINENKSDDNKNLKQSLKEIMKKAIDDNAFDIAESLLKIAKTL